MKDKWKVGDFCISHSGLIGYVQSINTVGGTKMYEIDYGYFISYSEKCQLRVAADSDFIHYFDQQLSVELERKEYSFKTCNVYFESESVSIVGDPISFSDAYDVAKLILSKIGRR